MIYMVVGFEDTSNDLNNKIHSDILAILNDHPLYSVRIFVSFNDVVVFGLNDTTGKPYAITNVGSQKDQITAKNTATVFTSRFDIFVVQDKVFLVSYTSNVFHGFMNV